MAPSVGDVHALAPGEVVYLPDAHGVQLLDDEEEANDPVGHGLQVEAPEEEEYVPASQALQITLYLYGEYSPATHVKWGGALPDGGTPSDSVGKCASVAAFSAYTL